MNFGLITATFIGVNLDFFIILLFLLKEFKLSRVMIGYLTGVILLMSLSFGIGKTLELFAPEWVLGVLGFIPIYMGLRDDDDDTKIHNSGSEIWNVFITYLAVCAGCNLSIFLPVLIGETFTNFVLTLVYIGILTILVVLLIKWLGNNKYVSGLMDRYGEILMKICYVGVGIYVLFDSGFIMHIIHLF